MRVRVERGLLGYRTRIIERTKRPWQSLVRRVYNFFYEMSNIGERAERYMLRHADDYIHVQYDVPEREGVEHLIRGMKYQRRANSITKYLYSVVALPFFLIDLILPGGISIPFIGRALGSHKASKRRNLETVINKIGPSYTDRTFEAYRPAETWRQYLPVYARI